MKKFLYTGLIIITAVVIFKLLTNDSQKVGESIVKEGVHGNSIIELPQDLEWTISKKEPNEFLSKILIDVRLNKKVEKNILRELSNVIRDDFDEYDILFIFYRLPENPDGMAWATAKFNPRLSVDINGSTIAQDAKNSKDSNIDGEVLGTWRSEEALLGGTMTIYKSTNNKYVMRTKFSTGHIVDSPLSKSGNNGKEKYSTGNKHGEYYIIETSGNLSMFDGDGKYEEAQSVE